MCVKANAMRRQTRTSWRKKIDKADNGGRERDEE